VCINSQFHLFYIQIKQTMDINSNLLFNVLDDEDNSIGHCQIIRLDQAKKKASIGRLLIYEEYRAEGLGKLMRNKLFEFALS
ncbi:GNAT family N-acetyltransferase, partial [Francisella tularensis]|uniref:GNAT family N-acetyltransferase n=1 Tax=Francisella tularensis TaxID=263 RepID=UPI002381C499